MPSLDAFGREKYLALPEVGRRSFCRVGSSAVLSTDVRVYQYDERVEWNGNR